MSFDRIDNREIIRELKAIRAAETHGAQRVGPVMGMDSEFAVYKAGLKKVSTPKAYTDQPPWRRPFLPH